MKVAAAGPRDVAVTGGSAHGVVLVWGPQPPQAPLDSSPGLRTSRQKRVQPTQDLQCCALQSKQAEAEGRRDKSDVAGRAGTGNEADAACAQERGRHQRSLHSAPPPARPQIPQGLGATGQETGCCGFVYTQNQVINAHAGGGLGFDKNLQTVPAAQPQPYMKEA